MGGVLFLDCASILDSHTDFQQNQAPPSGFLLDEVTMKRPLIVATSMCLLAIKMPHPHHWRQVATMLQQP